MKYSVKYFTIGRGISLDEKHVALGPEFVQNISEWGLNMNAL
jgi:hypothetical protein